MGGEAVGCCATEATSGQCVIPSNARNLLLDGDVNHGWETADPSARSAGPPSTVLRTGLDDSSRAQGVGEGRRATATG